MQFLNAAHTLLDAGEGRIVPTDPLNSDYAALLAAGTSIAPYQQSRYFAASRVHTAAAFDGNRDRRPDGDGLGGRLAPVRCTQR